MTFASLVFVMFFLVVLTVYSAVPAKTRAVWLLFSSYFFFASFGMPHLLLVLLSVTLISYLCGIRIHNAHVNAKKFWMVVGVIVVLAHLISIKYLVFLAKNTNQLLAALSMEPILPVPQPMAAIGVSYFVFQGLSYIIDIYLEVLEPEKNIGRFALSMNFFPKILQGPIERGSNLLPQLCNLRRPSRVNIEAGIHLFLWGLFKKIVVADRLAMVVDPVYNNVHSYEGVSLLVATYLYAFQIYFDFSGYTDMALGIAKCFGINLTQNFNRPYMATSVAEFWRRWHISFSSWILDYIFKPLQFSFRNWLVWGTPLALLFTFLVSGLWHGASWTFIAWGGIHGLYMGVSHLTRKTRKKLIRSWNLVDSKLLYFWQLFVTFNLVSLAWVFFRSKNISDAIYVIGNIFNRNVSSVHDSELLKGLGYGEHLLTLFVILAMWSYGWYIRDGKAADGSGFVERAPVAARGCLYGVMFYLMVFHGADTRNFIYLQF